MQRVLASDFISDMLKVTSGKSFEERRDHAIIRLHGPRRAEVASMDVGEPLTAGPAGVAAHPIIAVITRTKLRLITDVS